MSWSDRIHSDLDAIVGSGLHRRLRDLRLDTPVEGTLVEDERPVVSFASNDYLGLTRHPGVVAAAHEALDRAGTGTGASRLIVGSRPEHRALETEIAHWKRTGAALLFPHGLHRQPRCPHRARWTGRPHLFRRLEPCFDHRRVSPE
ncbi:MAG: hypothetical protein M5U31_10410 [Acidimicrobiia bacterium]|nr:hypothetical protein [Acidimicrobiia bacterium]